MKREIFVIEQFNLDSIFSLGMMLQHQFKKIFPIELVIKNQYIGFHFK